MFERKAVQNSSCIVLALVFICHAPVQGSYILPFNLIFRDAVGSAKYSIVGTVCQTKPYSRGDKFRESILFVEEVLFGPIASGDSLVVNWRANEWHPRDGGTASAPPSTQLESYNGVSGLWVLRFYEGSEGPRGYWVSFGPFEFSASNSAELKELVELLDNPKPEEMASHRSREKGVAHQAVHGTEEKQVAVSRRMKQCLRKTENTIK